jgi:hypothetical protein
MKKVLPGMEDLRILDTILKEKLVGGGNVQT